jgi:ATP-dependent protease ClpP protease subunit
MKRLNILNNTSSVTSDDDNDTPFDPASLFNLKKENDIKVDGNKIYFYKGVSRDSVLNLIGVLNENIKKLKAVVSQIGSIDNIPIYLFINSEGGDYFAGLSAMDHIKNMNYPIYTVIDGMVASAATFISLAGTKRFITRSSWVLVHQIRSWFGGMYTHEQLKDEMENSGNIMKSLNIMYSEHTRIPKKKLDQFFKHDLYIDSSQALKYGIADYIYSGNDSENIITKKQKIIK